MKNVPADFFSSDDRQWKIRDEFFQLFFCIICQLTFGFDENLFIFKKLGSL